jgi:hypothetical protein
MSADECRCPELNLLLTNRNYNDFVNNCSISGAMRKEPILASIHFKRRWKAFLKYILKDENPPIGIISDFFARVEYQNRGSPHLHIFCRLKMHRLLKKFLKQILHNFVIRQ